jgi:flagellar biosynthetic protein FliO
MTPTSEAAVGGGYGEMLVGSLLVLGLVCLAAWVVVRFGVRRMWGPRGGGVLDVIARVPLEPRRSLYVVDVGGKVLLVGTSEMGLNVLSELDRDAVKPIASEPRPSARSFAEALRAVLARRRGGGTSGGDGDKAGG